MHKLQLMPWLHRHKPAKMSNTKRILCHQQTLQKRDFHVCVSSSRRCTINFLHSCRILQRPSRRVNLVGAWSDGPMCFIISPGYGSSSASVKACESFRYAGLGARVGSEHCFTVVNDAPVSNLRFPDQQASEC